MDHPMMFECFIPEIKRPLTGFDIKPNYYISNLGYVQSKYTGQIIKPTINSGGYPTVRLPLENGDRKTFYVYRLVANEYVPNPNPEEFDEVNHKNRVKTDCIYTNLEWCTREYNNLHKLCTEPEYVLEKKESTTGWNKSKLTDKQVRDIRSMKKHGYCAREIKEILDLDVGESSIRSIASGKRRKDVE